MSDTAPDDELQELIERWRDIANADPMDSARDRGYRNCADELEDVITDE